MMAVPATSATGWSPMDRQAWGRGIGYVRDPQPPYVPRKRSLLIITDGSYADGRAGIAYAGDLGARSEVIEVANSGDAENAALLMAMHAVYRHGAATASGQIPKADFVTDWNPDPASRPDAIQRYLAAYQQWKVVGVQRHVTHPAHRLAIRSLRRGTGFEVEA